MSHLQPAAEELLGVLSTTSWKLLFVGVASCGLGVTYCGDHKKLPDNGSAVGINTATPHFDAHYAHGP